MTAYGGILEAILKRSITGKGDEISISLFDVAADWMAVPFIHAEYGQGTPKPVGLRHPSIAPYGAFKCSDERLVLISIQNEREWERFCKTALGSDELFENSEYKSNTLRVSNRDQLELDITRITSQLTSQELQSRLQAATIAYGALNEASDLRTHDAFRAATYVNAEGEEIQLAAHPVKWTNLDSEQPMRSPKIGEHTQAIAEEFGD